MKFYRKFISTPPNAAASSFPPWGAWLASRARARACMCARGCALSCDTWHPGHTAGHTGADKPLMSRATQRIRNPILVALGWCAWWH